MPNQNIIIKMFTLNYGVFSENGISKYILIKIKLYDDGVFSENSIYIYLKIFLSFNYQVFHY